MNVGDREWRDLAGRAGRRAFAAVFGDRLGLTIFVGSLVFFGFFWRIDVLLNDSLVMANTLANVAEGRLAVTEMPYAPLVGASELPGYVEAGGQLYGRNYGHLFVAVPLVWALDGLAAVADLRVVLAGAWSLLLAGFASLLAARIDRPWLGTVGAALAIVLFALNLATGVDLAADRTAMVALQLSTMAAAALAATLLYRTVALFEGASVGAAAGAALALSSPVAFWSSFPKRHAVSAVLVVAVIYCFAVSRKPGRRRFHARLVAYALTGLYTLVHPREAIFLFAILVPLDLLSAPSNSRRTVLALVGVFSLSLVPFFIVNTLISGNPLVPPRMLLTGAVDVQPPDLPGGEAPADPGGGTPASPDGSNGTGGAGQPPSDAEPTGESGWLEPLLVELTSTASAVGELVYAPVVRGLDTLTQPERLYHTFIRSGRIPGVDYGPGNVGIELAFTETFPLAGGLVGAVVGTIAVARRRIRTFFVASPERWTDLFAVAVIVVFGLVNVQRLPLHAQLTPRYLLPLVPPAVYLLARTRAVGAAITRPRWLVGGYLAVVFGGGLVVLGTLAAIDPARGEAMQFHALVGLGTAVVAAALLAVRGIHEDPRLDCLALALPAGATTVFLLATGIEYFTPDEGTYALGITAAIAELLPIL